MLLHSIKDKRRVRQLVEQLAVVGAEKEQLEKQIFDDRHQFSDLLTKLKAHHQKVLEERQRVVDELQSSQLQLQDLHTYPTLPVLMVGLVQSQTSDRGIGVFACEFIPANASVYECNNTLYFTEEETRTVLNSLPSDRERKYWLEHSYGEKGLAAYDLDDTIMVNHSFDPNLYCCKEDGNYYAARDIKKGEELTEDYRIYKLVPFLEEICQEYGVHDAFLDD